MNKLHILLKSENLIFSFDERDFLTLREQLPDLELCFLNSEQELLEQLPEIENLDTWYFEAAWYEKAERLKRIFTPAAGRDWVKTHPRVPAHFGTFHGILMAETALGLVLNFSLKLPQYRQQQVHKIWRRVPMKRLDEQRVIILGFGSIGKACGRLLRKNGMNVTGVNRTPTPTQDDIEVISEAELDQHLPKADHVISFLPGGDETKRFMSEQRFKLMSANAYFYNFGRGTTVDEDALLAALQNEQLAGAALDVTQIEPLPLESPLWHAPNITLLPHASAYFDSYRREHVTELINLIKAAVRPINKN